MDKWSGPATGGCRSGWFVRGSGPGSMAARDKTMLVRTDAGATHTQRQTDRQTDTATRGVGRE